MQATLSALAQAGLILEFHNRGIKVSANGGLRPLALSTAPFPGFATDMQAQFMAMLALAEGDSFLEETIFENRYMHVPELRRMGASVDIHGRSAIVHGIENLTGANVMATDLGGRSSLPNLNNASSNDNTEQSFRMSSSMRRRSASWDT